MITPKPNDYVKVTTQEEYDIAVKAFVKAGFDFKERYCEYNLCGHIATFVLVTEYETIMSDNDDAFCYGELNQLTIPQLLEYLSGCVYEVGDVVKYAGSFAEVISDQAGEKLIVRMVDGLPMTIDATKVTDHYKLQEKL